MSIAIFILYASILSIFIDNSWVRILAITGIVYSCFCFYFTYHFIIANRKDAVWTAILGGSCLWFVVLWFFAILYTPEDYEESVEWNAVDFLWGIMWPLFLYGILSSVSFGIIRLVMSLKKYGASAWSLLDVSRRKRPLHERILICLFFIAWLLPVGY